ncbi:UDP-N-acetylmuramate dehydrogenase [Traorella massiliensis]|mgnify:CR=1 FL=1|uniref:UDP-N-acetylmuramate dehydrogenase n=1 Tax=Traorella massiliensis TaxID=1903263 RepID=UPI0008F94237|nr:UDP-N-acetylmuramate dehydrogenase [Traorella massiliensis]
MNEWISHLNEYCDVLENEPLALHTTYKVGGKARYFVYPKNEIALMRLLKETKENQIKTKIIGKGSNLLVSDDDYDGMVICLDRYFNEVIFEKNKVSVYAGQSIIYLAHEAMKRGLSGLEFASGIPGTVGGACFMNAGAYKSEMKDVVEAVWVLKEGNCVWMSVEECEFSYRNSIFKRNPDWVILAVRFHLTPKDPLEIKELMDSRRQRRMASQPLDKPSAGSVFKNPEDMPAWKYIEESGLRGKCINGAKVSEKHANFIVNEREAKAQDIYDLIELIQKSVYEKFNVFLKAEVECFNWKRRS